MIDIKIVTLKETETYINDSLGYVCEEDKAYSIHDYELFVTKNAEERKYFKKNFGKEKLDFLEIVRRNSILEEQIKFFREKFKIEENLPFANYYYHIDLSNEQTDYDVVVERTKDITIKENIEITEEQYKFIKKIYKQFHIHELLRPLLVNLLYTGKILLSQINIGMIRIEEDAMDVNIVISSNKITQHTLTSYIEDNWKEISNKIEKIPNTQKELVLNKRHKAIYDMHFYDKKKFADIYEQYNDYANSGSVKSIANETKKKIESVFKLKKPI